LNDVEKGYRRRGDERVLSGRGGDSRALLVPHERKCQSLVSFDKTSSAVQKSEERPRASRVKK